VTSCLQLRQSSPFALIRCQSQYFDTQPGVHSSRSLLVELQIVPSEALASRRRQKHFQAPVRDVVASCLRMEGGLVAACRNPILVGHRSPSLAEPRSLTLAERRSLVPLTWAVVAAASADQAVRKTWGPEWHLLAPCFPASSLDL